MASGFTVSGRGDLDALFLARVNAKRADVGFQVAGVDISNRYEPIGAGTPIAATGFKSGGTDLASLFRNIGEPVATVLNLTAGFQSTNLFGYKRGAFGALAPDVWKGVNVNELYDLQPGTFRFVVAGTFAQGAFTSIVTNSKTFNSAAASTFNSSGGITTWIWNTQAAGFSSGNNYTVTIN